MIADFVAEQDLSFQAGKTTPERESVEKPKRGNPAKVPEKPEPKKGSASRPARKDLDGEPSSGVKKNSRFRGDK